MLNPLIDEIFELILLKKAWMVHTLAAELMRRGHISSLDPIPERDLFKRNFLIMNALYQLQQQLHTAQQLVLGGAHIELISVTTDAMLAKHDPLRDYYLQWQNFETSSAEIAALLTDFWRRFNQQTNVDNAVTIDTRTQLLAQWQLPQHSTLKAVQKRWRQLALQHHPDKANGAAHTFRQLKTQYEQLKASYSI
ncbi:DNA-J related domain-containing protein [Pseudoalteromonas sp.]|uniref:DNA-J related domain-containing protein n=1 Tax=Pseudoalteromonas sp. TaxID=53249 RepID=UPI00356ACFF0